MRKVGVIGRNNIGRHRFRSMADFVEIVSDILQQINYIFSGHSVFFRMLSSNNLLLGTCKFISVNHVHRRLGFGLC